MVNLSHVLNKSPGADARRRQGGGHHGVVAGEVELSRAPKIRKPLNPKPKKAHRQKLGQGCPI